MQNLCARVKSHLRAIESQSWQEPESNNATHMGFQQTVMYGEYSKALGELAKKEAREDTGERRFYDEGANSMVQCLAVHSSNFVLGTIQILRLQKFRIS